MLFHRDTDMPSDDTVMLRLDAGVLGDDTPVPSDDMVMLGVETYVLSRDTDVLRDAPAF